MMQRLTIRYILIGLAVLAVLIVISTLGYSLFFGGTQTEQPGGVFPAGEGRTTGSVPSGASNSGTSGTVGSEASRLFQMHDRPVVSAVAFERGGEQYVRFMEEGSGHVYEYDLRNRREYRISNTSIPQIAEALWSQDGTIVAFRYEDGGVLKAAVGELSTTTEERAFQKVHFLPEGIRSLALSPNGRNIFYITNGQTLGTASGIVALRDGSAPNTLFTSKLSQWFATWPSANAILISSPWSAEGGIAYRLDPTTGSQRVLYTTTGRFVGVGGGPRGELLIHDPATGRIATLSQNGDVEPLLATSWPSFCSFSSGPTSTVACADIPSRGVSLFNEWARGEYDFSSNLVIANLSAGATFFTLAADDVQDRIFDVVHPTLSPNASYATFKNRVDGLLWGITLGDLL